jgi:hypothetical protein
MMNNALTFLGIALGIAVVGGLVVLLMHRDPEASSRDGVDEFQRIMGALAPDDADSPAEPPVAGDPAGDVS